MVHRGTCDVVVATFSSLVFLQFVFRFRSSSGELQRSQDCRGPVCPFCAKFCATPTGLVAHLTASHDRCLYLLQVRDCLLLCSRTALDAGVAVWCILQQDKVSGVYNVIVSPNPALHSTTQTSGTSRLPPPDDMPTVFATGQVFFPNQHGKQMARCALPTCCKCAVDCIRHPYSRRRTEFLFFRSVIRAPASEARRRVRLLRRIYLRCVLAVLLPSSSML